VESREYDFNEALNRLENKNSQIRESLEAINHRQPQNKRDIILIPMLSRALELSESNSLLVRSGFAESANMILRGLLENLIQVQWISLSEENAEKFERAMENDILINIKSMLKNNHAEVRNTETGEVVTEKFLENEKLKKFEEIIKFGNLSRETGLEKLYAMLYGSISSRAHGIWTPALADENAEKRQEYLLVLTSATSSLAGCINNIVLQWTTFQNNLSVEQIHKLLGIPPA
jgi:Family of unknown function (DUF5677)